MTRRRLLLALAISLALLPGLGAQAGTELFCSVGLSEVSPTETQSTTIHSPGLMRARDEDTKEVNYSWEVWASAEIVVEGTSQQIDRDENTVPGEVHTYTRGTVAKGATYVANLEGRATWGGALIFPRPLEDACSKSLQLLPEPVAPMGETESPPGDGTGCVTDCWRESPILIDLDRGGFWLTSLAGGVAFDLNADGERERLAWVAADSHDAFLALDRNGNGRIDDGTELFGDSTPQPTTAEPNGFRALAVFDEPGEGGNDDGLLSKRDAAFSRLLLWRDGNQDGVSDPPELSNLPTAGLVLIELTYVESRRRDRHGNELRYASRVRLGEESTQAVDVFLLVD